MSSEPVSSKPARSRLGFRQAVVLAISVLSLAVVGLTVANIARGPRLLGVELNAGAAVERAGQLLALQVDQPLTGVEPGQVTVAPTVPIQVFWPGGATVEVRFLSALRYATEYQVSVAMTSAATGTSSTVTHSFRTPPAELYVLQRNGSDAGVADDQIVRIVPGSGDRDVIYSAARIQEFAVSGSSLAVVTQDESSVGTLAIGPVSGLGAWKTVITDAVVSQLQASEANGVFGFKLQPLSGSAMYQPQLHIYDPAGDQLIGVKGLDGKPLDPQWWAFVPGTRSVVAQTIDALFFLIDTVAGSVKTLGGHNAMHGFVRGTPTLIFEDQGRFSAFDLTAGTSSKIPLADVSKSRVIYQLLALPDEDYVSVVARLEGGELRFSIIVMGEDDFRVIYEPEPTNSTIPNVCLSSNGQLLAIEAVPPGSETDGYDVLPKYVKSRVVVIDPITGNLQAEEPGVAPDWCG